MADQITYKDSSANDSLTIYAVRFTPSGLVWNGSSHVTFVPANWATYAIPLPNIGGGRYSTAFPAAAAGLYYLEVYQQSGGSAVLADNQVGGPTQVEWDGANEVPLSSRLAPSTPGRTLNLYPDGSINLSSAGLDAPVIEYQDSGQSVPVSAREGLGFIFDASIYGIISNIGTVAPIEVSNPAGNILRAKIQTDPVGNRTGIQFITPP